jgi:hypothetical protein
MTLLLHLVAAGYVAYGLFGLLVIAFPSNRRQMFGHDTVGRVRTTHAFLTVALLIASGLALWLWPTAVSALAISVLVLVITGKVIDVTRGQWRTCKVCILAGPLVVLAGTAVLLLGPSNVAGA